MYGPARAHTHACAGFGRGSSIPAQRACLSHFLEYHLRNAQAYTLVCRGTNNHAQNVKAQRYRERKIMHANMNIHLCSFLRLTPLSLL